MATETLGVDVVVNSLNRNINSQRNQIMANQQNKNLDFSILSGSLDDIEDLPGFNVFPSGAYHVLLAKGLIQKAIGEHPAVEMEMTCAEVLELSDPETAPDAPKVGDTCSTAFMIDNEIGRGKLKEVFKAISEKTGSKSNAELMAAAAGLTCKVVIKKTHDDSKDRDYANITSFAVVG